MADMPGRAHLYMLDASGAPVPTEDVRAWGEWFEACDAKRQVALTKVSPDIRVSTTFLGIDHSFGLSTEAVLWETLIFGGAYDLAGERYTSIDDARAGHELWVMAARGELTPDVIHELRQVTETT